jgi:hypothetical protein
VSGCRVSESGRLQTVGQLAIDFLGERIGSLNLRTVRLAARRSDDVRSQASRRCVSHCTKNTIAIAQDIPKTNTPSEPRQHATVSQLLIHLAVSPSWQQELHSQRVASLEGYDFPGRFAKDKAEEHVPRTKAEIIDLLQRSAEAFASFR